MQVSSKIFFKGLRVDFKHYVKVFNKIGVKSVFFYPVTRYKSAMVVNRAKSLLEGLQCQD